MNSHLDVGGIDGRWRMMFDALDNGLNSQSEEFEIRAGD
jgi:hypothetical protein